MSVKKIKVRLVRSPIGAKPRLRKTVSALGLKRLHSSVIHEATPSILGMVRTVAHLVEVEEAAGSKA